jgi:hypothetical protein
VGLFILLDNSWGVFIYRYIYSLLVVLLKVISRHLLIFWNSMFLKFTCKKEFCK